MYGRGSIVLRSNFQTGDFDGFTRFEVPLILKITFSAVGLCVCFQHNSKTICSRNCEFTTLYLYHM